MSNLYLKFNTLLLHSSVNNVYTLYFYPFIPTSFGLKYKSYLLTLKLKHYWTSMWYRPTWVRKSLKTLNGENSRTSLNLFLLHRHSFSRIEAARHWRILFYCIPIAFVNRLGETIQSCCISCPPLIGTDGSSGFCYSSSLPLEALSSRPIQYFFHLLDRKEKSPFIPSLIM